MNDLSHQLAQLEAIQLVRRLGDADIAYMFKHVLAQETTYQSLLVKTRRDIHRRVAEYYEQGASDAMDGNAAILAHHYFEAGDFAKTFHYALMAGDVAARLYAHPEALMYYERALEMRHRLSETAEQATPPAAEVSRLYTNRGRVFELSNRYEMASENYVEMEAAGRAQRNSGLELAGLTLRATLLSTYTSLFDPVKARELNAYALARAREIGDRAMEAKILWIMLLLAKYSEGNLELAIEHGERSLELARELGLREQVAYTLNDLAFPYAMTLNLRQSRAVLQEAIKSWQELGNLAMLSDTTANLVALEYYRGDLEGAANASAEALRLSQMTGSLWGQAYSRMWVGNVFAEGGDYGTALAVMEEGIRTAELGNFLPPQVITRIDHAWLLGELGVVQQALQEAELAVRLLEGITPFAQFVLAVQMRLYVLAGDLGSAERLGEEKVLRYESPWKNDPDGVARLALAQAELAFAKREYARALTFLEPAEEFLTTNEIAAYQADILYRKGKVLNALGDTQAALATLLEAQRKAQALPSRRMLWQILATMSEIENRGENGPRAAELREQARHIVEYIAERIGSEAQKDSFLALPHVRALYRQE